MSEKTYKFPRQDAYDKRQKEKGLVRVTVWVPPTERGTIGAIGQQLRDEFFEAQEKLLRQSS